MSDSSLTEASLGCELPAGFREFWELRAASARLLGEGDVGLSPLEFASPT